jgi:serine/threonine protein kinase
VAIKVITTTSLTENEEERLKREIEVNRMVSHRNICQVFEIYQGAEDTCLVME